MKKGQSGEAEVGEKVLQGLFFYHPYCKGKAALNTSTLLEIFKDPLIPTEKTVQTGAQTSKLNRKSQPHYFLGEVS